MTELTGIIVHCSELSSSSEETLEVGVWEAEDPIEAFKAVLTHRMIFSMLKGEFLRASVLVKTTIPRLPSPTYLLHVCRCI